MDLYAQQIELEEEMLLRTKERYKFNKDALVAGDRIEEGGLAKDIMKKFIPDVAEVYDELRNGGGKVRGAKYLKLVEGIESELLALIVFRTLFQGIHGAKRQSIYKRAARCIEDEIKFRKFKEYYPEYFTSVIRDLKRRRSSDYRHTHRVLTIKMKEFEVVWNYWKETEALRLGAVLVEYALATAPIFQFTGRAKQLGFTDEMLDYEDRFDAAREVEQPLVGPCIIPPIPWTGLREGGFHTADLQRAFPLIKMRNGLRNNKVKYYESEGVIDINSQFITSLNRLQETAWQVNRKVLDVVNSVFSNPDACRMLDLPRSEPLAKIPKPFPDDLAVEDMDEEQTRLFQEWKRAQAREYTKDRQRFGRALGVSGILRMARKYALYDEFYFVYNCDYRNRKYACTTGLNPQGADYNKGLLRFATGVPFGEHGAYWFKVHGANLHGFDKDTYNDRVRYIDDLHEEIYQAGREPNSNLSFLSTADKPVQFLAFCIEYAEWVDQGMSNDFVSHLPIAADGSCNGLQNLSAMLRDPVGAYATNVLPSDKPQDIYTIVADGSKVWLLNKASRESRAILDLGVNRKAAKRSVMCLPYGITKRGSQDYVMDWLRDVLPEDTDFKELYALSVELNEAIWITIAETVVAARKVMEWMQEVAKATAKAGVPLQWTTYTGFPVHQVEYAHKRRQIECVSGIGRLQIVDYVEQPKFSVRGQKNASAPNLVHSNDATHMDLTIIDSTDKGCISLAMIHDDFGTHAGNMHILHQSIRSTFVKLYENDCLMEQIFNKYKHLDIPEPPEKGDLDIRQVLASPYFFG